MAAVLTQPLLRRATAPLRCEDTLGRVSEACSGRSDLSLLFEQSFFSLAPSALLLIVATARIIALSGASVKVKGRQQRFWKWAANVLLLATQIALLFSWSIFTDWPSERVHKITIAASILACVATVAQTWLSWREHDRSITQSMTIVINLSFAVLFDAVQCRTLWLLDFDGEVPSIAPVFTAMFIVKVILLVLESRSKLKNVLPEFQPYALEDTSDI